MTLTRSMPRRMSFEESNETHVKEYHLDKEKTICIIPMSLDCHSLESIISLCSFSRMPPSIVPIYVLIKKVKKTASVEDQIGRGPPITVNTQENRQDGINYVERYCQSSISEIVEELN